ncbi:hypothetical protein GUJ93_ZPchr0001g29763 [Zizania palustris]|uniref:BHLH domain-containing protein n=1 Tax=Zizania palustris TaxID=103762 RepID=A0A8J5S8D6_ZIZPA|nr:hypothetical protein GUJ93_ZPchr0001g29763 [Zizania palustris]
MQNAQRPQGTTDKAANVTASNRVESTVVQTVSEPRSATVFADQRAPWRPQPKEVRFASTAAAPMPTVGSLQHEVGRDKAGRSMPMHKNEARKAPEATVATSSVCSGNGAASDEVWRQQKRKSHVQAECSASQDDDLDDEPGALRRSASRSMKRSRTAEVHNLSERRRRDRINEKMRALQELIPNCNKIDKASMLDEAIEYLKTLQLQVQVSLTQMMSLGTGLCIPPILLPAALQHLQIPPMAHFPSSRHGIGVRDGCLRHEQHRNDSGDYTHAWCSLSLPNDPRPNQVPQVYGAGAMGNMNQQPQCLSKEAAVQGANPGDTQMSIIMQGGDNEQFRIPHPGQTKSSQFSEGVCKGTNITGRDDSES